MGWLALAIVLLRGFPSETLRMALDMIPRVARDAVSRLRSFAHNEPAHAVGVLGILLLSLLLALRWIGQPVRS